MKYATIDENGQITGFYADDVFDTIPSGAIKIDDDIADAHTSGSYHYWDGSAWQPIVLTDAELLDKAKRNQRGLINAAFSEALVSLALEYPEQERESWYVQEKEARAYIADNTATTPLLDALATERGITKDDLAAKVIEKADGYAATVGAAIGKRQRLIEAIDAAVTPDDVAQIVW